MTGGRPIIAIVDNEAAVRKTLMRLLRAAGWDAETFSTGREFLENLSTRRYSCVVLDLHMPDLNGFDVQKSRAVASARIPTVIITARDEPGTRLKCFSLGAAAYLKKPFDDYDLISAVEGAISRPHESDRHL